MSDFNVLFPYEEKNSSSSAEERIAIIKVIGVGGGGGNAVNRMIEMGVGGVDFYAVNTDAHVLRKSKAENKIQIGEDLSQGKGVGADPALGKQAAEESREYLKDIVAGADMVIITAGMGKGTGTGASPVIAQIAREAGILTLGVVTTPFDYEGAVRMKQAVSGIKNLRKYTDALIVISNEKVYGSLDSNTSLTGQFRMIDDVLRQTIQTITDIITIPGEVNLDFNDVKKVLEDSKEVLIGNADAVGDDHIAAVHKAISHPMLEEFDTLQSEKAIINLTSNPNYPAEKIRGIYEIIKDKFNMQGEIFSGNTYDSLLDDKTVKIAIIATGIKRDEEENNYRGEDDSDDLLDGFETSGSQRDLPLNNPLLGIDPDTPAYKNKMWNRKFRNKKY